MKVQLESHLMVLEPVGAVESLVALFALVSTLTAMDQTMLVVNRSGEEAHAADLAPEIEKHFNAE